MKITYKLKVDNNGVVTEEEFERWENLIEKAKTYDPTFVPVVAEKKQNCFQRFFAKHTA